jgi:hypothetical protein
VSQGKDGSGGSGDSTADSISADGSLAVFTSTASNLVLGDGNGTADVFVRNMATGVTSMVSIHPDGTSLAGPSAQGAISGDGRFVAFYSDASNLVSGDTNGFTDVFVRDPLGVPPPPPPVSCKVPRVIGMRLAVARKKIGQANCNTGRVRRAHTAKKRVGKVLSQSPKAGSVRPRGTKVNLVVGKR